jgi:hypothetical protein
MSQVYTVPWQTNQRVPIPLNNWGYWNECQILLSLSVVIGTGGTVTDAVQAASNYLTTIDLRSPQGEQIWSTNSRDLYDFNYRLERGVTPSNDPSWTTTTYASAATYPVNFRLKIPVALNNGSNFDFGMLMRQLANNQFILNIGMCNGQSDLVGSGSAVVTSISGTVTVEEIYYDSVPSTPPPPPAPLVQPPDFAQYLRLRSQTNVNALVNGQNLVSYDTGPIMCDALHRVINNSAADGTIGNVTYINMTANGGNLVEQRTGNRIAYDNEQHLGKKLNNGVYHLDYVDDLATVNATQARDLINSNLATSLKMNVQYQGTPTGTSQIQSLYREIVTFGS